MRFAAMRPAFHRPESVADVCELLAADRRAIPYAGGTAIEIQRRQDPSFDAVLVDLSRVPFLDRLDGLDRLDRLDRLGSHSRDNGGLRVGPMVTIRRMATDPLVARLAPLAAAAYAAASPRVRNVATVGGSLAQGADRLDPPAALLVLGAVIEVMSIRAVRRIAAARFFARGRRTVLEPGDVVTAVQIPAAPPGSAASYVRRCSPDAPDWPCASAAALLIRDSDGRRRLRLAIGALGDVPGLAELDLADARENEAVDAALDAAGRLTDPVPGVRGSVAYQRAMGRLAVEGAVRRAWRKAGPD
jgi:aerobic carbon-monoxide dehydrogenase medium subunit